MIIRGKELMSCRQILWCLFFSGCLTNYMLKICFNLAIVAMVVPRNTEPPQMQCVSVDSHPHNSSNTTLELKPTLPPLNMTLYEGRFNWSEYDQGLALGAFYWTYWTTNIPGGIITRRYGTKKVFGLANFVAALMVLLIPMFIKFHLYAFIALRAVQGVILGVVLPSMHSMTAKWIPPNERSKFVSCYTGSSVGAATTYILTAAIIHHFNWEAAFYTTSVLTIIWCGFWAYFAYDSPQQHPRISKTELKYITESISSSVTDNTNNNNKTAVPWGPILKSKPFWAVAIANFGLSWGFYTLIAQGPTYFTFIHGWDMNMIGIISGTPHLLTMIFSYIYGAFCDWLIRENKMSRTAVRKLSLTGTGILQSLLFIALSLSGCYSNLAVFLVTITTMIIGASTSGMLANLVELSPNNASILLGTSALLGNIAGAISPVLVGILTNNNQTMGQWRIVFWITAGILVICGLIFLIWGSGNEQSWNNTNECDAEEGEELQKLQTTKTDDKKDDKVDDKKEASERVN